jgi:dipeptidyl aminopeptidase/acylaminoacyl peptidase
VTFNGRIAYFLSRGWNVLVPDHRGSTGHGRAYAQALRGRWGELDVADVQAALAAALDRGWARAGAIAVIGGSAGGFTALGVAAAPGRVMASDPVAAVVALYPVTDLLQLTASTHRFEARYCHRLVGPLPEATQTYRERSIVFRSKWISAPLLLLHGDDDKVVPVAQSAALAERITAEGGGVTLHIYQGEGHGWKRPDTVMDELHRVEAFLDRHIPKGERDR